jgi:hypothetical protein
MVIYDKKKTTEIIIKFCVCVCDTVMRFVNCANNKNKKRNELQGQLETLSAVTYILYTLYII